MEIKDRCKVFFTSSPTTAAPTAGEGDPAAIIDGRVAVHGIVASSYIAASILPQDTRPYYLCGSADATDIYFKFCPIVNTKVYSGGPVQFIMGGNGLLFENGVYLGKDATAPNGSDTAQDLTVTITIFYTGGANA